MIPPAFLRSRPLCKVPKRRRHRNFGNVRVLFVSESKCRFTQHTICIQYEAHEAVKGNSSSGA